MRRSLPALAFLLSIFTFYFGVATWGATAPAAAATFPGTTPDTRVYTLAPLDFNVVPTMDVVLNGACLKAGGQCAKIPTQASLDLSHVRGVDGEVGPISIGSATLDTQLKADGNNTKSVIFGYSQGAQIAGFWLRNRSKEPAASLYANPANTSFFLIGDPENTYGAPWTPRVPTNTPYRVTELWKQYDGWADWPTRPNPLAIANAIAGQMYVHPTAYLTIDPTDPKNVTWTNGNMTYILVPNKDLPIVQPLRWIGLNALADTMQERYRPIIEAAYDRPETQEQANNYMATGSRYGTTSSVAGAASRVASASADKALAATKVSAESAVPAQQAADSGPITVGSAAGDSASTGGSTPVASNNAASTGWSSGASAAGSSAGGSSAGGSSASSWSSNSSSGGSGSGASSSGSSGSSGSSSSNSGGSGSSSSSTGSSGSGSSSSSTGSSGASSSSSGSTSSSSK